MVETWEEGIGEEGGRTGVADDEGENPVCVSSGLNGRIGNLKLYQDSPGVPTER